MKTLALVLKIILFATALFILGILLLELVLWNSGENWSLHRVITYQDAHPEAIFQRGKFKESLARYKYLGLLHKRPRVAVLASPTASKLRKEMFGDPEISFYNAGGLVFGVDDLEDLLTKIDVPFSYDTIVVGVDFWWLNDYYAVHPRSLEIHEEDVRRLGSHVRVLQSLISGGGRRQLLAACARMLRGEGAQKYIGLYAHREKSGYRTDGSLKRIYEPTGRPIEDYVDRDDILRKIRAGEGKFAFTDGLSKRKLQRLRLSLREFQKKNVLVIGYLAPIANEAEQVMLESKQRKQWQEFNRLVPQMFEELGIPYVNASTPKKLDLDDRYMSDGSHAEELFYVHLLRRLADNPRVSTRFPSMARTLDTVIQRSRGNYFYPTFHE